MELIYSAYLRWPADPVQFSEVLGLVSEQIGQIQSSKVGRAVPRIYEDLRRLVARRSVSSHEDWSEKGDKLDPLHLLYSGILRTIPQESRPLIRVLLLSRPLPAQSSANLLFLDQASFYENIWKLHLVLDVPDLEDAERLPLRLRSSHEAFGSYLDHVVNEYDVLAHIEKCYNKWCDLWGKLGSDPALFELQGGYFPHNIDHRLTSRFKNVCLGLRSHATETSSNLYPKSSGKYGAVKLMKIRRASTRNSTALTSLHTTGLVSFQNDSGLIHTNPLWRLLLGFVK